MCDKKTKDDKLEGLKVISTILEVLIFSYLSIHFFVLGYLDSIGVIESPSIIESVYFFSRVSLVPIWRLVDQFSIYLLFILIILTVVVNCISFKKKSFKIKDQIKSVMLSELLIILILAVLVEFFPTKFLFISLLISSVVFPSLSVYLFDNAKLKQPLLIIMLISIIVLSSSMAYSVAYNHSGNQMNFQEIMVPSEDEELKPFLWKSSNLLYVADCPVHGQWQVWGIAHDKIKVHISVLSDGVHDAICKRK